ncbi:hypothetical protein [Lentzea flaviverrucosa]|uniref:hypothetical protein n=1 Tax=Lentzea flaviverrucosa TaxID=200379 RepID=UPI000B7E1B6C|nr:hypothetical protein [Lentzea flaviverrucosa]
MSQGSPRLSATEVRRNATALLDQLRELLAAAESGELPVGAEYRHRLEGAITAVEAVLGLPPSLAPDLLEPRERKKFCGNIYTAVQGV